jgi:Tol biopolymer transport system component
MRFLRPACRVLILAAAGLAACHHDSTGPQDRALLRFSGASTVTDTIGAVIPQALLVEVHDSSGGPVPAGTVVRFTPVPGGLFSGPEVWVEALTSTSFGTFATDETDGAGKAGILVRLGNTAGPGRLAVAVPALGLEDTVRFTIKPGNAVQMLVTPTDTLLYVGKSFTPRGTTVDRYNNPRADPATWSTTTGSGITVSSAGLVTATAVGQYPFNADGVIAGTPGTSTGWVSVVPQVRFAGIAPAVNHAHQEVVMFDADGANKTTLAPLSDGVIAHPAWIPGTSTVAYTTVANSIQMIYTVSSDASPKPFFSTTPPNLTYQAEPTPTTDGKWLFFSAFDTQCSSYEYCIARAKIDGTGYQLLRTTPSRQPAPSPDGTQVAFFSPSDQMIRVLDVATNTTSTWSVSGSMPTWSPDGTQIAYRNASGGISVVHPDGSGARVVAATYTYALRGWSPDGKWLLGQRTGGFVLLDVATGSPLPLNYRNGAVPWSMK